MKLVELRKKFIHKYGIRVVAGVLTVVLLGSGMTTMAVRAESVKNSEETETESTIKDTEKADSGETDLLEQVTIEKRDKKDGKEESVYILTDAAGNAHETIVTSHLINDSDAASIEDCSDLSGIENVRGDESYTADGEKLVWQADGKDIYYRGTTGKEAPVTQKVTYYLDGEEITPELLAGKSGRVTIRFDYTNNTTYKEKTDDGEVNVSVPFAAVTAMVLDDSFSHVEVTNGKLESNGDKDFVIGYTLPGLKESLDVKDSDFTGDVTIPDYFEVSADVTDFKLDAAMTVVVNAGSMISMEKGDESSLDSMISELTDATAKLRDGSADLADGMDTLQESLAEYASGMGELYSKSGTLADGVNTLNSSAKTISSGINTLDKALNTSMDESEKEAAKKTAADAVAAEFANGKTEEVKKQIYASLRYAQGSDKNGDGALYTSLYDGAYSANAAAAVYDEVVRQVLLSAAGQPADSKVTADQAAAGIKAGFASGAKQNDPAAAAMYAVTDGMGSAQLAELLYAKSGAGDTLFTKTQSTIQAQLAAGRNNEQINGAVEDSLNTLAGQLAAACEQAASQAAQKAAVSGAEGAKKTIASQIEAVQSNGYSLVSGAAALSKGTQTLASQVPVLTDGITKLNDATGQIVDGVDELQDGSHKLADGMVEFDEDGISKIVNSYNKDLKPLTDRLQAVFHAAEEYQTFTGLADGVNGSVKFIYKMDAVKSGK